MSDQPIRTSRQIRRDFLNFFAAKHHTIVSSASLMPDAPNLLFTNAGMNQFVPIFLGTQNCPYQPARAADTQKCIRAGGKHNDLEDVGLDTSHHTFFEMLGNWSFGDYFKSEAIHWAWELLTEVWGFPAERLYATIYHPNQGEPGEFDQEAHDHWSDIFISAGLDPAVHIINGGKKDNFWMMGDTGPCGPCSELHIDLTSDGNSKGRLVNTDSAQCIEIWNLVFIQYNADEGGSFAPLASKYVDTGMGFERVTGIIQSTNNFTDFTKPASNYDTDIFSNIFAKLETLSSNRYTGSLPSNTPTQQERIDIAFRVIGDHIRTLSFSIADGILPGNTDRNYVLRRILRRAVRYGRTLGQQQPFLYKLVDVLIKSMSDEFPELREHETLIHKTIRNEEEAFNKTLDRGIELFRAETIRTSSGNKLTGEFAFKLYDTYGFPLDLTRLMARENGLDVDAAGFNKLMDKQRARARAAQKKEAINVSSLSPDTCTEFVGFDVLTCSAKVIQVVRKENRTSVVLNKSPFYAAMGGQVGDTGTLQSNGHTWTIIDTQQTGDAILHLVKGEDAPKQGGEVEIQVDAKRRANIQRHHSVTHLFHWALHEITSPDSAQKGSYVGPEKLTFDFNSQALSPQQIADIENLVNERIVENAAVSCTEIPLNDIRQRSDILQFFGDKYGDNVRVVQIGGDAGELNGYSMELCGGTHTHATGEIGLFRIIGESGIATGVRRIEAIAGLLAVKQAQADSGRIAAIAKSLNSPIAHLEKKITQTVEQSKNLEKQLKSIQQGRAAEVARILATKARATGGISLICANLGDIDPSFAQAVIDALKGDFEGVVVLGSTNNSSASLVASVSESLTNQTQAEKIIQVIAPIVGGKGGGKPTQARGAGKDTNKLDEALAEVPKILTN